MVAGGGEDLGLVLYSVRTTQRLIRILVPLFVLYPHNVGAIISDIQGISSMNSRILPSLIWDFVEDLLRGDGIVLRA